MVKIQMIHAIGLGIMVWSLASLFCLVFGMAIVFEYDLKIPFNIVFRRICYFTIPLGIAVIMLNV